MIEPVMVHRAAGNLVDLPQKICGHRSAYEEFVKCPRTTDFSKASATNDEEAYNSSSILVSLSMLRAKTTLKNWRSGLKVKVPFTMTSPSVNHCLTCRGAKAYKLHSTAIICCREERKITSSIIWSIGVAGEGSLIVFKGNIPFAVVVLIVREVGSVICLEMISALALPSPD